ncbi:AraC family transcriptional regulator [filamentous cyanobacterium CCT1]|nr:AraC family transcriptional regulator [filamentous cyanobacterium CCT1]PSN81264.1 AraC family transcriptional regulator [filamentous cyanobacterium CCP4]
MHPSVAVLDHRQVNPVDGLLPRPAVLSSSGWDGIHLELYRQPKFATADHQHTLHAIALGFPDRSNQMPAGYRWLEGQRHRENRPAGGIAIIPAGMTHRCSWDSAAQFMVLAVEPDLLKQMGQDWVNPDRIELRPQFMEASDRSIATVLATLKAEAEGGGLGSPLLVDSLKTTLAIHLLRHYCTTQPRLTSPAGGLSQVQREQVKAYVEAHLHQELTLVELAAIAHLSPAYFARLFKQSEGVTPHQYILQRRVERAQFWLRHSPLSLAEIAARVGFCDQSHLTRWFKRLTGATPTQFRQP